MIAKPFLKWAGGKTQLLTQFEDLFPEQLKLGKISRYVEPFIGSGAIFFNIIQKYDIKESYISDINQDLILTYKVVKNNVSELIEKLAKLQDKYLSLDEAERQVFYYEIRDQFNNLKIDSYEEYGSNGIIKASLFIFLNRTCFNGLFRVNSKGLFNVPFGKYKNPTICDKENLKAVNLILKNTHMYCGDYKQCYNFINEETFAYFDPPYRPINATSSFTAYAGEFNDSHQIELAQFFTKLHHDKRPLLMLSNSDPKNYDENDDFFDKLYSEFQIRRVSAKRNINSVGSSRGAITEILVTNYNERWKNLNFLEMPKEELTKKFVEKLLVTNRGFNFYVNWNNAEDYKDFDIELHAMDVLIKNEDFDNTFKNLLKKLPTVVATFPYLFALSKGERQNIYNGNNKLIVANSVIGEDDNLEYDFSLDTLKKGLTDEQIEDYLFFFENIGLKHLFMNLAESCVTDYVIGVLVGLDTNGRKNRGGLAFELACTPMMEKLCSKYKIELITQKQFKILRNYGFVISDDMAERKADFILVKDKKCLNIEVNYYNGAGSKPEEIIDSYITREYELNKDHINFALITDGKNCWGNDTKSQLLKAFRNLKYFMNFNLAKEGMLEEVIKEIFLNE